ncbi:DUF6141 family protein [Methanofollis fontis]|uniref:Bacterial Pleckstrin homology domain-containing protein n=1 Tax=Methanofollis fontis TaxID=2052832 RepID=A0A483CY00_9EURY|nr:DUF6141 family protein [Methanofollis fontis]TAJ44919.1 hypothetical protein CUJ86_06465 [Methanofollis fontis]
MNEVFYREVQHFRQVWVWAILLVITAISWWMAVQQLILGRAFGPNPAPDWAATLIFIVFGILFPLFFIVLTLTLEVRTDGLYYRFFPLHLSFRRIGWEETEEYRPITYSPLREYGGWGIRRGRHGWAYTTGGNRGVLFRLSDGRCLLFGSDDADALAAAVRSASGKRRG